MKSVLSLSLLILFMHVSLSSQNLIRNSSFDEVRPYSHGDNHSQQRKHFTDNVRFWNTPSGGTPDIIINEYRKDPKYNKVLGPTQPRSGESMIGVRVFGCYKHASSHCREYIQTKTKTTLHKGECYEYEFYVQTNWNSVRINGIGIGFSEFELNDMSQTSIVDTEHLKTSNEILFEEVGKWVKFSGSFTAEKDYNHVIIGNFLTDKENIKQGVENGSIYGYYYLDDISLYKINCQTGGRENGDKQLTLSTLTFDHNSYKIDKDLELQIKSIYDQLKNIEFDNITINGHTDSTGSDLYNIKLSQKRAEYVLNALSLLGIPKSKMVAIGHGSVIKTDQENKNNNRRVEIVLH